MNFDVIIAGAGPAGSAAAIVLRQAGLKVCLIDELRSQSHKIGESLPGAAQRLLHRLGIGSLADLLPADAFIPCSARASAWGAEEWHHADAIFNPEGGGWRLKRLQFDEALRQRALAAGAVWQAGKVTDLKTGVPHSLSHQCRATGQTHEVGADWLIDATGRAFALGRRLGAERHSNNPQMALAAWLSIAQDDVDNTTRTKSVAEGWWYTARLPANERVLVFHGLPEMVAHWVHHPELFWTKANEAQLITGGFDPAGQLGRLRASDASSGQTLSPIGENWLAVGDAALTFDPLSSQGIFFALYSGIRGAEAIVSALHQPAAASDALLGYAAALERVYVANQQAQYYYYHLERRYGHHAYWQQRQQMAFPSQ